MITDAESAAADRFAAAFGLDVDVAAKSPWFRTVNRGLDVYYRYVMTAKAGPPPMHAVVGQEVRVDGRGCGFDVMLASSDEAHDSRAAARDYARRCLSQYMPTPALAGEIVDCDPAPDPYLWVVSQGPVPISAQVAYPREASGLAAAQDVANHSGRPVRILPLRALPPIVVEPAPRGFKFVPSNSGESEP